MAQFFMAVEILKLIFSFEIILTRCLQNAATLRITTLRIMTFGIASLNRVMLCWLSLYLASSC
jgi:hypothetical protein